MSNPYIRLIEFWSLEVGHNISDVHKELISVLDFDFFKVRTESFVFYPWFDLI